MSNECVQRILTAQRQEGKRTPREDMYRIACQIANGMAYLHSKHVVHRWVGREVGRSYDVGHACHDPRTCCHHALEWLALASIYHA
jgi:hypothetical protein